MVDLIKEFERAERRPPGGDLVAAHAAAGVNVPAIVMPVPSRITWRLPLPRRAVFRAFVARDDSRLGGAAAPPVRFRLGISDDRIYEGLTSVTLEAGAAGTELRADLSAYAGRKWSLFYRPDAISWHVVLAADALGGGQQPLAVWGRPEIAAPADSVREYVDRLRARHRAGG